MTEVKRIKASELTPDIRNANKGTERGRGALETSLRQYGAGRSILVDKHGRIVAGNKTLETAAEIGLDDFFVWVMAVGGGGFDHAVAPRHAGHQPVDAVAVGIVPDERVARCCLRRDGL